MKNVLSWLGGIFLLLLVGYAGLLMWAYRAGESQQQRFFDAIASRDPEVFVGLMDDSLAEKVDPPVLRQWMASLDETLGPFEGLAKSQFATKKNLTDAGWVTESSGDAVFRNGTVQVELTLLDDKLVGYEVSGDLLKKVDWLKESPADEIYRERSRRLIRHLVAREADEAIAMMHEKLRERISAAQLVAGMTRFAEQYGELEDLEVVDERFVDTPGMKSLTVRMLCSFSKQKAFAEVRFEFDTARGHITAFDIPAD
jgi:hypothetical protein